MTYDSIIIQALANFHLPHFEVGPIGLNLTPKQQALCYHFEGVTRAGANAFLLRYAALVHQQSKRTVTLTENANPRRIKSSGIYFKLTKGNEFIPFVVGPHLPPFQVMH